MAGRNYHLLNNRISISPGQSSKNTILKGLVKVVQKENVPVIQIYNKNLKKMAKIHSKTSLVIASPAKNLRLEMLDGNFEPKIIKKLAETMAQAHLETHNIKIDDYLINQKSLEEEFNHHYFELISLVDKKIADLIRERADFHNKHKEVLLHGNLRSNNIYIKNSEIIIDNFESSRLGYPSWDIAHILADYIIMSWAYPELARKITSGIKQFFKIYFQTFNKIPRVEIEKNSLADSGLFALFRLIGRTRTSIIWNNDDRKDLAEKLEAKLLSVKKFTDLIHLR